MPQWAGSCWYYLRFIDPTNSQRMLDAEAEKYWMPVDLYVGGAEHAVLHLLYARFWHKVLYDIGMVSHKEPFQRLVSQGMILGEVEYVAMQQPDGTFAQKDHSQGTPVRLDAAEVEKKGDRLVWSQHPDALVTAQKHKMSKSRGNVVNPDDVVYRYGADSLRLYEMFLGPLQDTKVWSTNNIEGVHRFLARVYRLIAEQPLSQDEASREQMRLLHATIKKVTEETSSMRFNTGIAAMMEFVNGAYKWEQRPKAALEQFVLLLAPYAPHLSEEMWQVLGHDNTLTYEPWPTHDEALLVEDSIKLPVQVNGKLRATLELRKDASKDDAIAAAQALPAMAKYLDGKTVKKIIYVPSKILNLVVK